MINSNMNDESQESADAGEFEVLLANAFDAPPIPRSLLKRLDNVVEQEWGVSPRLADTQAAKLQRSLVRGSRWLRRLPIAAALAIVVICAVLFNSPSRVYGWSIMLDALQKQGVVQISGDGVTRWLALSEGLVSETTAESSVLLDTKKKVVLRRSRNGTTIERESIDVESAHSQDRLVLAFLIGESGSQFSSDFLASARVAEESWKDVTIDGVDRVQLNVKLEGPDHKTTSLQILVDPKTHLPVTCSLDATGVKDQVALSYPVVSAAERVTAEFPADVPVVDVDHSSATKTATNDATGTLVPSPESSLTATNLPAAIPDKAGADLNGVDSPLFGAASKWKPVELTQRGSGNVVTDLDDLLGQLWRTNEVEPVAPASDEELLRRVYLDLAGRTPSVNEVRAYLKDTAPDRYEVLVDRLLNSPDHASHLAATFRSFLIPEGVDLTNFGGVEAFDKWLAKRFESNESYDTTVQSLLLAEGRLAQSGPLLFYSATKLDAEQLAGRTARVFLGMRLECAQCHDHPFEPWAQKDFWSFAAFFARISRPRGKLETVSTVMQVRDVERGEVMMPESKDPVAPKFLNSTQELTITKATDRRHELAQWLTGRDNPYFARATANRVWSMMFGKGIVNPVDDFGVGNRPLSPELLDLLARHFINSNFDLRDLFRVVALSKAYRLSSGSDEVNESREEWFAQMNVKMLTAEQVYDGITVATMPSLNTAGTIDGFNINRFGNASREQFLQQFRTPTGRLTEYQGGIPQALTLMNGSLIDGATGLSTSGLLKSLAAPFFTRDQRIEILYFATLAREPKPAEKELLDQYITKDMAGEELRAALSDVLWALLNSAEFTMNH